MELRSYGHRFVYDPATLEGSLRRSGYVSIKQFVPGESDDPALTGIETRHKMAIHAVNDFETMVFEATKP